MMAFRLRDVSVQSLLAWKNYAKRNRKSKDKVIRTARSKDSKRQPFPRMAREVSSCSS